VKLATNFLGGIHIFNFFVRPKRFFASCFACKDQEESNAIQDNSLMNERELAKGISFNVFL